MRAPCLGIVRSSLRAALKPPNPPPDMTTSHATGAMLPAGFAPITRRRLWFRRLLSEGGILEPLQAPQAGRHVLAPEQPPAHLPHHGIVRSCTPWFWPIGDDRARILRRGRVRHLPLSKM